MTAIIQSTSHLFIVSGAQTGADRAGLDWAISRSLPHGGWCPKGRRSEDGLIPAEYELQETPSAKYQQRTEWNVRDSDATVIFTLTDVLDGGSKLTAQIARSIEEVLQPRGVAVVIEAAHECMTTRGIHKRGVSMVTSKMLGSFRDDARTRAEFLQFIAVGQGR